MDADEAGLGEAVGGEDLEVQNEVEINASETVENEDEGHEEEDDGDEDNEEEEDDDNKDDPEWEEMVDQAVKRGSKVINIKRENRLQVRLFYPSET